MTFSEAFEELKQLLPDTGFQLRAEATNYQGLPAKLEYVAMPFTGKLHHVVETCHASSLDALVVMVRDRVSGGESLKLSDVDCEAVLTARP